MTQSELRQNGFQWQNVEKAFLWDQLSKDFMRELVEYDQKYKTWLEHALMMDFHGYSVHASAFYKNMFIYIQNKMYEQKQLEYYLDKVKQMYWDQKQQEQQARIKYSIVDGTGRVLDSWVM